MAVLRILLASDGSSGALRAADWVEQTFEPDRAIVTVVAVAREDFGLGETSVAIDPQVHHLLLETAKDVAKESIDKTIARMPKLDPSSRVHVAPSVVPALLKVASDIGADVIVVGRRGHRVMGSIFMGSVSLGLLMQSSIPVWIIPPLAKSDG